jgi:hypothetical protein
LKIWKSLNKKYFIFIFIFIYILSYVYIKTTYHDKKIIEGMNKGKLNIACVLKNDQKLIPIRGQWSIDKEKNLITNGKYIFNVRNCFEY